MRMTVKDLREALANEVDETLVSFQGNIKGEEDSEDGDDYTYTESTGHVFAAFNNGESFVIDCAITDSE